MERAAGLTERRWVIFEKPGVVHLFSNEAEDGPANILQVELK